MRRLDLTTCHTHACIYSHGSCHSTSGIFTIQIISEVHIKPADHSVLSMHILENPRESEYLLVSLSSSIHHPLPHTHANTPKRVLPERLSDDR